MVKANKLENYFHVPQTVDNTDTSYLIDYSVYANTKNNQGEDLLVKQNLEVYIPKDPVVYEYDPDSNLLTDSRFTLKSDVNLSAVELKKMHSKCHPRERECD